MEAEHHAACVACELPKLKIHIAPLSSEWKQNESVDEDKAEEAEPKTPICEPKRKWSLIVTKEKLMKHSTIKLKCTVTKGKNKENALFLLSLQSMLVASLTRFLFKNPLTMQSLHMLRSLFHHSWCLGSQQGAIS